VIAAVVLFWGSLAALAWTHALYPLTVALAARLRTRHVARDDAYLPSVAVIVTAYNEEHAIERRLENLRGLDYPPELLELVVTSDASTDRTEELAEGAGAHVIRNRRGGKVSASGRRRALYLRRGRRLHRRELHLGPRRAAQARPQPRRPWRRVRLWPAYASRRRTARTRRASTGGTSS